jgi:hypothetical protein
MRVMSNALFSQAEVTQADRWEHGPLEIRFVPEPCARRDEFGGSIVVWNCQQTAGYVRSADNLEDLQTRGLITGKNPNIVIAPTWHGYSELLGMLGSLMPDEVLRRFGIGRPDSNFWLWPCSEETKFHSLENLKRYSRAELRRRVTRHLKRLASIIPEAFEHWIWSRLVRSRRFSMGDFSRTSSLRRLSGDIRFWMSRVYRVAIDLYEGLPPVSEEKDWSPLEELEAQLYTQIPASERRSFTLARPRVGGDLWNPADATEREDITGFLLEGGMTIDSLGPVVEVLLRNPCHEDFSDRYSWVKEDFERSFYSKRSRVKVSLHEFVDQCPVHDGADTPGYENILFRDIMAFFDERDRRIILALRHGRTQCQIAEQLGYSGHAAVSRRVKRIERKLRQLLL